MRLTRHFRNWLTGALQAGALQRCSIVALAGLLSAGILVGSPAGQMISKKVVTDALSRGQPEPRVPTDTKMTPPRMGVALAPAPDKTPLRRATLGGLRDPFRANGPRHLSGLSTTPEKLPRLPGIAGLAVGELQLHGLVEEKLTHRMVAVVTNGGRLSYFLHENDQLYDGTVTRITPAAVYLTRKATPSGGNPMTGSVVLRLQPEPGDKP
jgi:hypothetical protein